MFYDQLLFELFKRKSLNRVYPGIIRHAQKLTGLVSYDGRFFADSGQAAEPLAILAVALDPGLKTVSNVLEITKATGLNRNYAEGFSLEFRGFNAMMSVNQGWELNGDRAEGGKDGAVARKALKISEYQNYMNGYK